MPICPWRALRGEFMGRAYMPIAVKTAAGQSGIVLNTPFYVRIYILGADIYASPPALPLAAGRGFVPGDCLGP